MATLQSDSKNSNPCPLVATEGAIFTAFHPGDDNSTEARISRILWQWRFSSPEERAQIVSDSQLALLLEYWFPFTEIPFTRRLGTWCDGIPLLTVSDLNRNAFAIAGVGYFPNNFSPFELEFHYSHRRDLLTSKIVLRFGIAGRDNRLESFPTSASPEKIFARRPREVRDWAVAVELSPQDS